MKKIIITLLPALLLIAACDSDKKMNEATDKKEITASTVDSKEERNKKVIMASMESFMKGDLDGTFKDAATSFVDYADGSMAPITNLDSLKALVKMITMSIEGYKGENLHYYADGDYVLVHGDWMGTFRKDLMGIKATNKPVKFKDVDIFKLNEEGKIIEHSAVQNIGAILMTAGMTK